MSDIPVANTVARALMQLVVFKAINPTPLRWLKSRGHCRMRKEG